MDKFLNIQNVFERATLKNKEEKEKRRQNNLNYRYGNTSIFAFQRFMGLFDFSQINDYLVL